jgi:hypothetical protein
MFRAIVAWIIEGIEEALRRLENWNERRVALSEVREERTEQMRRLNARLVGSFSDLVEVEARLPREARVVCEVKAAELEWPLAIARAKQVSDGCLLRAAELEVKASTAATHGTAGLCRVADLRRRANVLREAAVSIPSLARAAQHLTA